MKSHVLHLNKKVKKISSFEILNSDRTNSSIFDTVDELSSAEYIIDKEKILSDRIKVLEEELQRTREDSFQAGYQEGKIQGTQEAKKQIDDLKILIKSFEKQYTNALTKMEIPLLKLAKKMAAKVISIDLDNSAELDSVLMEKLKKLLREIVDQVRVLVEVNPIHLEWLESPGIENELNSPKSMEINFIGNEKFQPGECKIYTEGYHIDETYETKLNQIEQQLLSGDN